MASILDFFRLPARRANAGPFTEAGFGGTAMHGGFVGSAERNPKLVGSNRWRTAQDLLTNASIVAASVRYFLNLAARPAWKAEAANDKPAAKEAAEFLESVMHGTDQSWSRIIRRSAIHRFHGFGIHEWQAKRRDDGRTGFAKIRARPPHTIERWDMDEHLEVQGVWQRSPDTSQEIYLPRSKIIYLVDDALTDSPEGLGWYRHLADPWVRLEKYLKLEGIGFERDMSGIPIGRAPISSIKQALKAQGVAEKDLDARANEMLAGINEIVRLKSKASDTGFVLDSQTFVAQNADGAKTISDVKQWDLELLTGEPGSVEELGAAIGRTVWDMALIMGTERLLVGREGAGSLALSENTSQNLFLNINSATGDMAEAYDRDFVGPLWALNGLDPELRPTLKVEDASFKDIEKITRALADMAAAGAVLTPDDPAIDDVRDLAGISRQPEMTPERLGMLQGGLGGSPNDDPDNLDPDPTDPEEK
jgi:hypothetical protein